MGEADRDEARMRGQHDTAGTNAAAIWLRWLIGALVALLVVGTMVFVFDYSGAGLLGWAVGMIISSMLILFGARR